MPAVNAEDIADLSRITEHMERLLVAEPDDLVVYAIALAETARAAHKSIMKFGGPDISRYEHLGKIMQELDK